MWIFNALFLETTFSWGMCVSTYAYMYVYFYVLKAFTDLEEASAISVPCK